MCQKTNFTFTTEKLPLPLLQYLKKGVHFLQETEKSPCSAYRQWSICVEWNTSSFCGYTHRTPPGSQLQLYWFKEFAKSSPLCCCIAACRRNNWVSLFALHHHVIGCLLCSVATAVKRITSRRGSLVVALHLLLSSPWAKAVIFILLFVVIITVGIVKMKMPTSILFCFLFMI